MNRTPIRWAVAGLGFSSVVTQLVLMRELLGAFQGNELILGVLLGNWLLLTGLGAWLGQWTAGSGRLRFCRAPLREPPGEGTGRTGCRPGPPTRRKRFIFTEQWRKEQVALPHAEEPLGAAAPLAMPLRCLAALQLWIAWMPFALVLAVRLGRNTLFVRGASVGLDQTAWSSLLLLAPYCVVSGVFLTLASRWADEADAARGATVVYLADCVGSVAGGALFTFALVRWLDHLALLAVPAVLNLLLAALTLQHPARVFHGALTTATPTIPKCGPMRAGEAKPHSNAEKEQCRRLFPATEQSVSRQDPRYSLLERGFAIARKSVSSCRHEISGLAGRRIAVLPLGLAALTIGIVVWADPDALTTAWQCRPDRVVFRAQSPYGRLVVTESAGQLNFIENGLPLLSSHQVERAEEIVHMALAQRPAARNLLLISGALSGTIGEILKHRVTNITCVELDPAILEAGRRLLPDRLADPRVSVINTDGRRFVQRTAARYDVAIIDMPAPATAQLNRYYTAEFFAEIKRVLEPGGVVAFGLGQYDNYVSPDLARVLASAAQTLRQTFREVLLLPAGKVWFLGSDGPLTTEIADRLQQTGVPTRWMRPSYLDAMLTVDRLAAVRSAADQPAPLNADFHPVLYFLHLRHWLSQFDVWLGTVALVLGVALVVYTTRLSAPGLAVFSGGFAGSSLEVVVLLGVQVLYGSLYRQLGLIVTLFMAGLAAGAWIGGRLPAGRPTQAGAKGQGSQHNRRRLAGVAFALALYGLLLPWAFAVLGRWGAAGATPWLGQAAIALLAAVLAVLVGVEFPMACRIEQGRPGPLAARLFAADFVGACAGAVLAGAVLVPVLGVRTACGVAAGLNVLAGLVLWWRERTSWASSMRFC